MVVIDVNAVVGAVCAAFAIIALANGVGYIVKKVVDLFIGGGDD